MEREAVKARIVDLLTELSPEDKKWVIETLRSENVIRRETPFDLLEDPHTVGMVICEEAVACRIDVDLKKWMGLFRNATFAMLCQEVFEEPARINASVVDIRHEIGAAANCPILACSLTAPALGIEKSLIGSFFEKEIPMFLIKSGGEAIERFLDINSKSSNNALIAATRLAEAFAKAIANVITIMDVLAHNNADPVLSKKLYDSLADGFIPFEKAGRGGPQRKRKYLTTNEQLKEFAEKVNLLHEQWKQIIDYIESPQVDYDPGAVKSIKGLDWFKSYAATWQEIPEDLLKNMKRRRSGKNNLKSWPLGFALDHARRECGIKQQVSTRTLYPIYKAAQKLIPSSE